jgi:hypothetical protein
MGTAVVHALGDSVIDLGRLPAYTGYFLSLPALAAYNQSWQGMVSDFHNIGTSFDQLHSKWDLAMQTLVPASDRGMAYSAIYTTTNLVTNGALLACAAAPVAFRAIDLLVEWRALSRAASTVQSTASTTCNLNPFDIRFTQYSVSQKFSNGKDLNTLIKELSSGKVKPSDMPAIRVVEYEGNLWSLDNRRLLASQNAKLDSISVKMESLSDLKVLEEFQDKYKPINGGKMIVVLPKATERPAAKALLRQYGKIE